MSKQTEFWNMATPLEAALRLASHGIPVLPLCSYNHQDQTELHIKDCRRPGKRPLVAEWQSKATTDTSQISEWFTIWPNSNVGALTGGKSGLIAIDMDGEFGRTKLEELAKGDLPPTWEFETPGGGYRYLYRAPSGYGFKKVSIPSPNGGHEELAFLADGQQTVMPGSTHASGRHYTWAEGRSPDEIQLADAPEWMLRLMSNGYEVENGSSSLTGGSDTTMSLVQPSSSTFKSTSTSTSTYAAANTQADWAENLKGMPKLTSLAVKCPAIHKAVQTQLTEGCHEELWFRTISLLCRIGADNEALAFSRLSPVKHNAESERRISKAKSEAESTAYGPPRCTTFGCGESRVSHCFESVRHDAEGNVTNSPGWFLTHDFNALAKVESLLKRTRYKVKSGKLGQPTFDNKGEENGFSSIANFVAVPTREVSVDDGAEISRWFEIEGVLLSNGQTLRPLKINHTDFADLKWISEWGMAPNLEPGTVNKERMRHAIQQLAFVSKQVQVYGHLGFRQIGGKWRYLHAGGCIGEPGIGVEVDRRLEKYVLPESAGDVRVAVGQSLSLLEVADRKITTLLLALVYLAPLCEALRSAGSEPSFVVWLYGQTGTRKSTIAALFLSHFGNFSAKGPPASFKDTANSLERRAFDTKDTVLWIDDFHPSSNSVEARKMEQIVQSLLRAYGDRVGRGRMRSDASLRPDYPPRGLVVGTGELLPDGHSSNARMQAVEMTHQIVDLDKLTKAQSKAHLLAEAMAEYVKWVGERMDDPEYPVKLARKFQERRDLALPSQSHGRLAEAAAWLYLGLDSLLEFAEKAGVVSTEERLKELEKGWETLLTLSEEQSEQVDEVRPAKQFLSVVAGLLENGSLSVLPADRNEREKYDGVPLPETHVGWKDNDHFYFLPDILYNKVNAFLQRQDERVPLKKDALWKQLEAAGCLVPEVTKENGKQKVRRTRKKSIDGKKVPTVWLKLECLEERDEEVPSSREQARRAAASKRQPQTSTDLFSDT